MSWAEVKYRRAQVKENIIVTSKKKKKNMVTKTVIQSVQFCECFQSILKDDLCGSKVTWRKQAILMSLRSESAPVIVLKKNDPDSYKNISS